MENLLGEERMGDLVGIEEELKIDCVTILCHENWGHGARG